jgi:hypothetical protein
MYGQALVATGHGSIYPSEAPEHQGWTKSWLHKLRAITLVIKGKQRS